MSLFNPRQSFNQNRPIGIPEKPIKEDKSIFGGKSYISSKDLARKIKKASPFIPGAGGAMYNKQQRDEIAKEIGNKVGSYFEKKNFEDIKLFRQLNKEKYNARTGKEKLDIDRKIRFLEREIKGNGK